MADILSYLLVCLAMISVCMGVHVLRTDYKRTVGKIMAAAFIASSAWSFGIGIMINLTDKFYAWLWRCYGIIGTYIFMIAVIWLLIEWNNFTFKKKMIMRIIPVLFILVMPANLLRSQVTFSLTKYGMAYAFVPGIWSGLYTYYYVIEMIQMVYLLVNMYRCSMTIHEKIFTKKLVLGFTVTGFGMVFDTVMPMLGFASFPGSTLAQAFSVLLVYNAYWYERNNSIDMTNLSRFVYDLMQEPILIYDKYLKLKIINNSGNRFLQIGNTITSQYRLDELFEVPKDWYILRKSGIKYEAKCRVNNTTCGLAIDRINDVYGDTIGFIVVVNDMTEKIQTMNQMEQAKIQAERANEAKSTFLANMSHEIRTPINAVLGMDEMILRESQRPEIIDYAKQIRSASKSLLSIINEILDFSKIESGKMELAQNSYESVTFFKDIVRIGTFRAKNKNIKISLDMDNNFPQKLFGDEMRIKQVINNIMTNAIKYTDEGSVVLKVWFEDNGRTDEESKRQIIDMKISVKDTGRGISQEKINKLFESFQRLDEAAVHEIEGTGLGLSIVKGLLDMMGGSIEVESEPGKGSDFRCTIPQQVVVSEPVSEVINEKKQNRSDSKWSKERFTAPDAVVLAVDDNRVNLTVLRGLLKRTQVQVETAEGGAQAVEKASKKAYHMIFMDHMMPDVDGVEALKRLKSMKDNESKNAVVIALTANAMIGMREKYLEEGFDDYLSKPIDSDKLELMMMKYLPSELVHPVGK